MDSYQDRQLIGNLPPALQEVLEFQAVMESEQPEICQLFAAIGAALKNQFILTLDEYGAKRWEKMLGISPKATFTLEERRFLILNRLNEKTPFTLAALKAMLQILCGEDGYSVEVLNTAYTLKVKVALVAKHNFDDIGQLLARVVPANMVVDLSLLYNQHSTLGRHTHRQLAAYTHRHLRNEVI